jgi:hypothetical protein
MAERKHDPPFILTHPVVDEQPTSDEFAAARMLGVVLIAAIVCWGAVLGAAVWLVMAAR